MGVCIAVAMLAGSCQKAPSPDTRTRMETGEQRALLPPTRPPGLTIFYGSELFGSLNGCGCMGNPLLGGLPFRFGYTEAYRAEHPADAVLQLDIGASMADVLDAEGDEIPDQVERNEWVASAMQQLGYDAVNVTHFDLDYLYRHWQVDSYAADAAGTPILRRFVSANVEPVSNRSLAPEPFVVRTVRTAEGRDIRIALLGVTEPSPVPHDEQRGYRVTDPHTALRRVLPEARKTSDVVIVMAYISSTSVDRILSGLESDVDILIVAHSLGTEIPARIDQSPRVVYSWYKTQMLGELHLVFGENKISSATNRYIKLDTPIPRDPLAERIVVSADDAISRVKAERYKSEGVNVQ